MGGRKILGIADGCNALELYALYFGFLMSFPSPFKRKIIFTVVGIVLMFIANVFRLTALAIMNMHRINAVDMAHHYVFKIVIYGLIFGLWVLFIKNRKK